MGHQIIRQPNGKYCLYSSNVDNIVYYNLLKDDIKAIWQQQSNNQLSDKVDQIIEDLEENKKPYYQFTMSFEEMMNSIKERHGDKEYEEIMLLISSSDESLECYAQEISNILERLRQIRNRCFKQGSEERKLMNIACDRLDVLESKIKS